MTTFSDLGVHFALFEAPVEDASAFIGEATCSLCKRKANACFELGIGCAIVARCASCGSEAELDTEERVDAACPQCRAKIRFPALPEPVVCCSSCLQSGRATITKDTELGMVSWQQAGEGLTHGLPGLVSAEFEIVPTDSDWNRARVDQGTLFELLRTPTYSTIQGERWLFCCREPMVFIGAWTREQFVAHAPNGDGKALLATSEGRGTPLIQVVRK